MTREWGQRLRQLLRLREGRSTMEREHPPQFINLLRMNDKEKGVLREKLLRSRGSVQVWVHTHYQEERFQSSGESSSSRGAQYERARARMMQSLRTDTMPVIAFIEDPTHRGVLDPKYRRYYLSGGRRKTDFYYVLTGKEDPTPLRDEMVRFLGTDSISLRDRWDGLTGHMKELGVKRALISGRNYWEDDVNSGCVGAVQYRLKQSGIDATLSQIVYPGGRPPRPGIRF